MSVEFEWDPSKAAVNLAKHGVSFEEASSVFGDENALLLYDSEHSTNEDRFILLGVSEGLRLLVVIHCERRGGEAIRIISAREANNWEYRWYTDRRPE